MMDAKQTETNSATELARERTREAADRTLMAWIRTSLSLIGFGFTANKVLDVLEAGKPASPLHSTLVFALSFIALGAFGLLGAIIQYRWIMKRLQMGNFIKRPFLETPDLCPHTANACTPKKGCPQTGLNR